MNIPLAFREVEAAGWAERYYNEDGKLCWRITEAGERYAEKLFQTRGIDIDEVRRGEMPFGKFIRKFMGEEC